MSKIAQARERIAKQLEAEKKKTAPSSTPSTVPNRPTPSTPRSTGKIAQARARIAEGAPPAITSPLADPTKSGFAGRASALQEQFAADVESTRGLTDEARIERKKVLIEFYRAHAESFLRAGDKAVSDPVVPFWVVWLWDVGEVDAFITNSKRAEALGQRLPFNTTFPEFRQRRTLEFAQAAIKAGDSPEPYFSDALREVGTMPQKVGAQYLKLAGLIAEIEAEKAGTDEARAEALQRAQEYFSKADNLDEKVGVKTVLGKITKKIKDLVAGSPPPAGPDQPKSGADKTPSTSDDPPPGGLGDSGTTEKTDESGEGAAVESTEGGSETNNPDNKGEA